MNFCTLNPPNSGRLSDTVIGNVIPRTEIRHHNATSQPIWRQDLTHGHSPQQPRSGHNEAVQKKLVHPVIFESFQHNGNATDTVESLSSVINLMGQTDLSTGRKRPSCIVADLNTANQLMASIQEKSHPITEELKYAIVVDVLKKKIRNCRASQARSRNKHHQIETAIQNDISMLQREIEILNGKSKYSSRLPMLSAEYMRHFNYNVSSRAMLQSTTSKFLHDIMAPDVMVGSQFGIEAQLENWKLFALYFDDVQLELRGVNMSTSDTTVADTTIIITITSNTLRRAFPHLNCDGKGGTKGGSWSPLAIRILGRKLVMHGSVGFGWDSRTDKMVRVQFQADMMTPMIQLLGNLRNVSCVFNKARVTPDCRFA